MYCILSSRFIVRSWPMALFFLFCCSSLHIFFFISPACSLESRTKNQICETTEKDDPRAINEENEGMQRTLIAQDLLADKPEGHFPLDQNVASGKIYKRPSTSARVIGFIMENQKLKIIHQEGDWCVVKLEDGLVGWAENKILEKDASMMVPIGKISTPQAGWKELTLATIPAVLRKESKVLSEAIETIGEKSRVFLVDTSGNWYFVELQSGKRGWIHRNYFNATDSTEKSVLPEPEIKAIGVDLRGADKEEIVKILLNSFLPPETFVPKEEKPMLVCDFFAASIHEKIDSEIDVSGLLIEKIKIAYHESPEKKVRLVIDLVPGKKYVIEHIFFKKENLYMLVMKKKPRS